MSSSIQKKTRIAPTPSGYLHLGNLYNFILTLAYARREGLSMSLRIDDFDPPRVRDEYIEDIFRTLEILGFPIDSGPSTLAEFKQEYSYEKTKKEYEKFLNHITISISDEVFVCECSRKELEGHSVYPGICYTKGLELGQKNCLRLRGNAEQGIDDFILWRKGDLPSYHMASLYWDEENAMSMIIRGEDLTASTQCQLFLAQRLNFKNFLSCQIIHHPLIKGEKNEKLSKTQKSPALRGKSKKEIMQKIAQEFQLPGTYEKSVDLAEALRESSWLVAPAD